MTTLAVDRDTRDTLAHLETNLIRSLSLSLAARTTTSIGALWAIEDAAKTWPGLGLTPAMEECEGGCERYVHGATEARRLILCDECATQAHEAGEALLANRQGGKQGAARLAQSLRERIAAAEHPEPLVVIRETGHGIYHGSYPADVRR